MTPTQEQLLALSAVFQAASLVDKLARTGQISDAQLGCPPGHLVDGCLHPFAPAESDVELGEHRVLARAGRPQVARREDHGAEGLVRGVGEEHGARLRGGADTHTQLGNHMRHCQCSYGMTCAV